MAYVPGFENDVFISYCWSDNSSEVGDGNGWVTYFVAGLRTRLRELLGIPVEVWQDNSKLRADHALTDEIRNQIERTAVLVAVVTPSYLNSRWCTDEREWFLEKLDNEPDELTTGTRSRGVRVVKTPDDEKAYEYVFPGNLGSRFFREIGDDDFEEFGPTTEEFRYQLESFCKSIKGLLKTLRQNRVTVHVAQCTGDLRERREKLVAELTAQGFRVLPEIQVDSQNVVQVTSKGLEAAALSVHLFGKQNDALAVQQAEIAMDLQHPMIVWTSEPKLYEQASEYGSFLATLLRYQDPENRSRYLDRTRLEELKAGVLDWLQPRMVAPSAVAPNMKRVSILCDRYVNQDYDRASQIREWIVDRDGFQVDLPKLPPLGRGDLIAETSRLLSSDGILLYWGDAQEDWFRAELGELRKRPFSSSAIALGRPQKSAENMPGVIPLYDNFQYEALQPFLQPLRQ